MEEFTKLHELLGDAVNDCKSNCLALSGGIDSTVLAFHLKDKKPNAISLIAKDFLATDLTYCQLVAKHFDLPFEMKLSTTEELLSSVEATIKILKNFNDIEIRNSIVMHLVLSFAKQKGYKGVICGDGADELFAGYNFFLKKDNLQKELERVWKIMHFPARKIAESLGMVLESPFLDQKVAEFAKNIPPDLKIKTENGKKIGKWVLRKAYEDNIPKKIAWRIKSPLQDGAGTIGLTEIFNATIQDSVFAETTKKIEEEDDVKIRSKESLYYYQIYRKQFDAPKNLHSSDDMCPYCQFGVKRDTRFCHMCGSFPI